MKIKFVLFERTLEMIKELYSFSTSKKYDLYIQQIARRKSDMEKL